jgi:hypothetical protein
VSGVRYQVPGVRLPLLRRTSAPTGGREPDT